MRQDRFERVVDWVADEFGADVRTHNVPISLGYPAFFNPVLMRVHVSSRFVREASYMTVVTVVLHEVGHHLAFEEKGFWRRVVDGTLMRQEVFADQFARVIVGEWEHGAAWEEFRRLRDDLPLVW